VCVYALVRTDENKPKTLELEENIFFVFIETKTHWCGRYLSPKGHIRVILFIVVSVAGDVCIFLYNTRDHDIKNTARVPYASNVAPSTDVAENDELATISHQIK